MLFQARSAGSFGVFGVFAGFTDFVSSLVGPRSLSNLSCRRCRRLRVPRTISGEFRVPRTSRWNVNDTLRESGRIFLVVACRYLVRFGLVVGDLTKGCQHRERSDRIQLRPLITVLTLIWSIRVTTREETPITFLWGSLESFLIGCLHAQSLKCRSADFFESYIQNGCWTIQFTIIMETLRKKRKMLYSESRHPSGVEKDRATDTQRWMCVGWMCWTQ